MDAALFDLALPPGELSTPSPDRGSPGPDGEALDVGSLPSALPPGLGLDPRADEIDLPYASFGSPHAIALRREPSLDGDLLIADSYGGFYRYGTLPNAPPTLRFHSDRTMPPSTQVYCHRVATDPQSRTVLCGGFMLAGIARFEGASGRYIDTVGDGGAPPPYDLAIHQNYLYFSSPTRGLWRRSLGPGASLGAPERVDQGAYVRVIEAPGGLVALERSRGVVLRSDDGSVRTLALPGPIQNARVRGGELFVALGSQGVARVDLARGTVQHLPVSCVVSAVDASATALIVGCRQGARVYALPAPGAPLGALRDSTRAVYGVTDVLVEGDQLLVLDWRRLSRYTLRSALAVQPRVDRPLGVPVARERASRFEVVNPFSVPLGAGSRTLAPGARAWLDARPGQAGVAIEGDVRVKDMVLVATLDAEVVAPGRRTALPFTNSWIFALQPDCALQWLDLEDLIWLSQHGALGDARSLRVLVTPSTEMQQIDGIIANWAPLSFSNLATLIPAGTTYRDALSRISISRHIGGPDDTLVMQLDAEGRVQHLANQYLGSHLLRIEPAP